MSPPQKLQDKVLKLELQLATTRLIEHLFSESIEVKRSPGRYRFLGQLIQQHPQLLKALVENNKGQIQKEWEKVLQACKADVRFLQVLSILYWESAQVKYGQKKKAEPDWLISTALWFTLLSSVEFWGYFSQERWTEEQGERLSLDPQQQEALMHDAIEGILNVHSTYGKQSLASGNYEQAKLHAGCLTLCRNKGQYMQKMLQAYKVACALQSDPQRLDWVITQAAKALDEWCIALVSDAEKETNDAEAIKQLRQGIRKNYAGGLRVLEPFISLQAPIVRILSTGLDWYNDWCYDVYVLKEKEELAKLVKSARAIADRLMPLCKKEQGYAKENQLISRHYLLRGFVLDDPALARREYEEALTWDRANANALELLEETNAELYVKPAIEYAEAKQFDKAYQALAVVEQKVNDTKTVDAVRAMVYFLHANALAEEGKYREALARGRQAAQFNPTEEVIREFNAGMEALSLEEDNLRLIVKAEEAVKNERFNEAIQDASRIPKTSLLHKRANDVLALAYFARGMETVQSGNFDKAEGDLRRSLELNEDDEARKVIKNTLAGVLNARAVNLIDKASSRQEMLSRVPKAKKLLEEALQLDPTHQGARENLNMLKKAV